MPSKRDIEGIVEIAVVDVDDVATGYRASELIGSSVVNDRDERIGTIDDLMIGRDDRILFAVLQVGGFLRLGGKLIAVPYESLILSGDDRRIRAVLPGATQDELKQLAEFNYGR
jgi:sporulation protein YlmC with PRC-barrel domain